MLMVREDSQPENSKNKKIAVFDSGFGGLSVLKALVDMLPNEEFIYVGDSARYPYGPKKREEIISYSLEIAEILNQRFQLKLFVVACNTASSFALSELTRFLDVPVVGVIRPGIKAALKATQTGRIGVIGTVGTIASGAYQSEFNKVADKLEVFYYSCPGFVEFVEKGDTESEELHVLAKRLLSPLIDAKVDTLLLGCTHYPFLARTISDVMGPDVVLVSSADETAFEVYGLLHGSGLINATKGTETIFVSSGDTLQFKEIGSRLSKVDIKGVLLLDDLKNER